MILFTLKCAHGHQFEAWFRDGASFDRQSADGDVECPFCGNHQVAKAPMAPRLLKGLPVPASEKAPASAREPIRDGGGDQRARVVAEQILQAVERLRRHVDTDSEDVGDRFAEEARRIHYGETEPRGIHGLASREEAEELDEEGIEYIRMPFPIRRDG